MFSCCSLWMEKDDPADMEHLKALDEVDSTGEGEISVTVDNGETEGSGEFDSTPRPSSPRVVAAKEVAEAAAAAMHAADTEASRAQIGMSTSEVEGRAAAEAEVAAQEATRAAEAEAMAAEATRATAQAEAETATAERTEQTMRALREAEDAAAAAAAEAEKRRFEEEASARAARQAESEARKALWRAEEAQKVKEATGSKAAEEAAALHRIAQEEAELTRRQATAARMEEAKDSLMSRLLSEEGLRLQKHGRNHKSVHRILKSTDPECATLTWGKTLHELRLMQEVRMGTDADPAGETGATGTRLLRESKAARGAMERSFSLLFPSRTLDFTVPTKEECEQLVLGFRALQKVQK